MIRYIIALSELGLKNHDLIFLLQNNITYIKKMFYDSSLFESHNVDFAIQQNKPIFCPDVGDGILDIQTGTQKLINEHIATVIRQGRDIKNVLNAIGIKNIDTSMKNITIKKIFLHAILSILHNEIVLDSTIQELKLPFKNHSSFYKDVIQLIDKNMLDIDTLLNSLILNNIASIDKSLQFND